MRFRKAISGLNASPSQIKRKLKNMKPPGYNMELDEMLVLATMKMSPIIDVLMDSPKSPVHFIKMSECDDIEQVMNIVRDVAKALENIGFQTDIRTVNLNMDKYRKRANYDRQVYVDTTLLLGILELHNILEHVKEDLDDFYRSIGIHSFVQTESALTSLSSADSHNPNKIVFKFNPAPTADSSSLGFLNKDFIVMPSLTQVVPLTESKSQMLSGSAPHDYSSLKKSKSEVFVDDEEITGVTDVYGARKILVKCIYDLKGVSDYLAIPRMDASTIVSNVSEGSGRFYAPSHPPESGLPAAKMPRSSDQAEGRRCCCKDCFADSQDPGARFPECDEDQVIICIKGCNEDEGDVQIVIRQCPECKANSEGRNEPSQATNQSPKAAQPRLLSRTSSPMELAQSPPPAKSEEAMVSDSGGSSYNYNLEPILLHNKDSKGSVVCSDEEEEDGSKKPQLQRSYVQNQLSCSRIKLCETTNLCFETETGQELVISLTVTPKAMIGEKLSLGDIFSDSDGLDESGQIKPNSRSSTKPAKQRVAYFVPDRYIPLGRTKICSSLDFDVTTAASKIRTQGMRNKNNKIVVQLQDFGTDNLLRACRPAKCCRKAILNEKMKKCLPYAASLRSLPLDDDDFSVINQSLQMSLQKVKNSMDLKKDFQSYVPTPLHTVLYFFVEEDLSRSELRALCRRSLIELKLAFYINLANDVSWPCQYKILHFGVDGNNQANHSAKALSQSRKKLADEKMSQALSKWIKHSYEERPISPIGLVLDQQDSRQEKPSRASRIPVYRRPKRLEMEPLQVEEAADFEPNIYEASLSSLPRTSGVEDGLGLLKKLNADVGANSLMQSLDALSRLSKSRFSSKCSIGSTMKRGKRKKKEFYLSKSRSEISLNALQRLSKNMEPLSVSAILEVPSISHKNCEEEPHRPKTIEEHPSKIILNYFSKMLFEMIRKQMVQEQLMESKLKTAVHVGVGTESKSLHEIYRKPLKVARKRLNLSYHDLKAKQSQYCMVMAHSINTISLQTSRQLRDCKKCQTSNTLLACLVNHNDCDKTRIIKHSFNCDQSCDEIENFVVTFHSDQSCVSDKAFMSSGSEQLLSDSDQEDSLRQSLVRLKETLEQYESIKTEMAQRPQDHFINPIEYFVYHQVCACNAKVAKKPSMMQKILSKTKELFCSPEKDMSRKYNNQGAVNSMSSAERDQCRSCGCQISKCNGESNRNLEQLHPEEPNVEQPKSFMACCKKKGGLSKLASGSMLSLKSLKSRLKNSVSGGFKQSKEAALGPCRCVADDGTTQLTMCVSEHVQVVKCTGTSTMKDSGTQKCACGKCENFADDGTCCCSHCLGYLDKSFDAKPTNQNVAVETDATNEASTISPKSLQDNVESASREQDAGRAILEPEQSKRSLQQSNVLEPQFASDSNELNNLGVIKSGKSVEEELAEVETVEAKRSHSNEASATYFFVASPPQLFQQLMNFQQLFQLEGQDCVFNH